MIKNTQKEQILIYKGLQEIGVLELLSPEDVRADIELNMLEKIWNIIIKLRNRKQRASF